MSRHGKPPIWKSPYLPLDDTKDEIRLVTIEPLQSDNIVRCHLSTASLKEFQPEYSSFILASGLAGHSIRQVLPKWIQRCEQGCSAPPDETDLPFILGPSQSAQRYRWGDFAALSYTWGDEHNPASIFLDGIQVPVTRNLDIVLRTLAINEEFQDNYKIWIDAICINQSNEAEQASQVRKMREIYCGAWSVISWLGENDGPADVKDAFQFVQTLASLPENQQDLTELLVQKPGLIRQEGFFALHEFMKRPYWTRLWVVQELAMGASFTVLRCDDELLDLESFCKGISVLYRGHNWTLKDRLLARERKLRHLDGDHGAWYHIQSLHLVHQAVRELVSYESTGTGSRLGFRRLLQVASSGQCRDIRDKVFALLGLMEPQIAEPIAQDHSLDSPRLFAAVAKAFIMHNNSLEPLRLANPWGGQGAPTWAADWTWEGRMPSWRPGSTFTGSIGGEGIPIIPPKPETIYNADSKTPAVYKFSEEWRYLQCEGFVLDAVAGLGASERNWFEWDVTKVIQYPLWKSAYGDRENTSKAVYGALLGLQDRDVAQSHHFAVSSLPSTFRAGYEQFAGRKWTWLADQGNYYYKWEHWRSAHNNFLLGDQPLGSFFTDVIPDDADESTYVHVYCNIREMVMERRFMLTRQGYLGWAPDNVFDSGEVNHARVGDLVAIVFGCSTPLIIRPHEKRFVVVGEAYVQGFMNGEAVQLTDGEKCKAQSFLFC